MMDDVINNNCCGWIEGDGKIEYDGKYDERRVDGVRRNLII